MNFSIFNVFLKNRNIIFKMKISKVTDYAALKKCLRGPGFNSHRKTQTQTKHHETMDDKQTAEMERKAMIKNRYNQVPT